MTTKEFVNAVYDEKNQLLNTYKAGQTTSVGAQIDAMGLDSEQHASLFKILDQVLTDAYYTLLLGLDGSANLGGTQLLYKLYDEDGNELTGQIEGLAYERFHGGS